MQESPRWNVIGPGIGIFAGTYALGVGGYAAIASGINVDVDARVFIPVAGPLFPASRMFEDAGESSGVSRTVGALLVVDAVGQAAGLALIIAGASLPVQQLIHISPRTDVGLSPTSATLSVAF